MQQAGIYKIEFYENVGVSINYPDISNIYEIDSITNIGQTFEFNTDYNRPTLLYTIEEAQNNQLLNSYEIKIDIQNITEDTINNIEIITESVYGWLPRFYFMDNQEKFLNVPFFISNFDILETNIDHNFVLNFENRVGTYELLKDVV
jgi:hypothetical protein